jgi:hypothetical protein
MSVGHRQAGEAPPAPIATRVVLQLDSGGGGGPARGGSGEGGGETLPPLPTGPFSAMLQFKSERAYLQGRLCGAELLRAVLGLKRVGLRRLNAGTVALVVARPPGYRPPYLHPVRAAWVEAAAGLGSQRSVTHLAL